MTLNELRDRAHSTSRAKGWYDHDDGCRNLGEMLSLIHSELSEALECWRVNDMAPRNRGDGKPEGFPSEIADVLIRCFDLCGYLGIDIERAVIEKMSYNQSRPYRHGNKVA